MADWLGWIQRLRAISQTGKAYRVDPYDQERYQEISRLTESMPNALLAARRLGRRAAVATTVCGARLQARFPL